MAFRGWSIGFGVLGFAKPYFPENSLHTLVVPFDELFKPNLYVLRHLFDDNCSNLVTTVFGRE